MPLKVPICSFDAKTGILCPKCETKLKSGHLTKSDVNMSIRLMKLSDHLPQLNRVTLHRAVEVDGAAVLVVGSGELTPLRREPVFLRQLEDALGSKVWLLEGETSDRKFLEDLFHPVRILTVNVVWLPDGSKLTKVIIAGRRTPRFPLDLDMIKRVVKELRGIDLLVEFERS